MAYFSDRVKIITWLVVGLVGAPYVQGAGPTTAPEAAPEFYDRLVANYFAVKWDEVSAELLARSKEIATLPAPQKADVDYIRKAIGECRPVWWKAIKTNPGAKIPFRPLVWGQTLVNTYEPEGPDPEHRVPFTITGSNGSVSAIVRWAGKEMDDPTEVGELKFTKGDAADLNVWNTLGLVAASADMSIHMQVGLDEQGRKQLGRYLTFRGLLTSAYYSTPHARRLAIWNSISAWSHEYDKASDRLIRRSLGIFLNQQVLAHPEVYTTVPRPKEPPFQEAESDMVWELQEYLRGHDMSLREEKAFREALKAFAAVNDARIRTTQKALLPNGQAFSFDPTADKELEKQRNAWIMAQYGKKPEAANPKK